MSRPPRTAEWLVQRSIRRPAVGRAIVGDLWEEHAALCERRGVVVAALWYWLQALRIGARYGFGFRSTAGRATEPPISSQGVRGGAARYIDELRLDVRYAARGLGRSPVFSGVIIGTLALAIGANATMFSVVNRLLLSAPPHISRPDEVARLNLEMSGFDGQRFTLQTTSYAAFRDLQDGAGKLASWAGVSAEEAVLGSGETASRVTAARVSGNYFALLGTRPALGRMLAGADDRPPAGSPVVVISHGLWRGSLGGSPAALGNELIIDGKPYAVVGVAPPGFSGDDLTPVDLWIPINAAFAGKDPSWQVDRRLRNVSVIARLAPAATSSAAAQEASSALGAAGGMQGDGAAPQRVLLGPLTPGRGPAGTSRQAQISLWLGGVTLAVLIVAIANVTNLMLLRARRRGHEIYVRHALGVSRSRMLHQLLTESLMMAALGGTGALLVATWGEQLLRTWLLPNMAEPATLIDSAVLVSTGMAALLAGTLTGLLPALQAVNARAKPSAAKRTSAVATAARLGDALVLTQVGLSVVLLVGAGLFVVSLHNVQAQELGIRLDGVLLAEIAFDAGISGTDQDATYRAALDAVRKVPGVQIAVAAQSIPFGTYVTLAFGFPGKDFRTLFGGRQLPYYHAVEAEFFELMGVAILEGRPLLPSDDAKAPPAVVISESLAHHVWPGESPLGRCMRAGMNELPTPASFLEGAGEDLPCYEIVGVSADVAERSLLPEERLTMQWYTTFEQTPPLPPMMSGGPRIQCLLIRTDASPMEMAGAVQRVMQASSEEISYVEVRPYGDLIDPRTRSWRLGAMMFTVFGGLALVIAAIGVYGVVAYAAAQRTREMGVRLALGAGPRDIVRLVVGQALRLVGIGIVLGSAVALMTARYIEDLLYGTSAHDPLVFGGVAALLAAVAVAAAIVPSSRAARTDPTVTLADG